MALNSWQRNIVNEAGDTIPYAEVEVFYAGLSTKPDLFSDNILTPLLNPFDATESGFARFYADPGRYDIAVNGVILWEDVVLTDPFSQSLLDEKAPLSDPVFTGNPRAPTPPANDNDTSIATTAYVQTELLDRPQAIENVAALIASSSYSAGQSVAVKGDHLYEIIPSAGYTIIPDVDYLLANGVIAKRRDLGTLTKSRENHPHTGPAPLETLASGMHVKNRLYTGLSNPGIQVTGRDVQISNIQFDADSTGAPNQVIYVRDGASSPIFEKNYFNDTGYQIIQASGEHAYGVRAIANTSYNCDNDFVLQNNDFQNGITHSWLVSLNYADQTGSGVSYGATESRGVSFTTCYGGINAINAMVGIKGDSATHLENIQETVHALNYFRDCYSDVLFSGLPRLLISLSSISGTDAIEIDDQIIGVTSGATCDVLFWLNDYKTLQSNNLVGSFQRGESFTVAGKDTTGIISYIDPVQVHANVIGNIFHKATGATSHCVQLGTNNYSLRNHFSLNSYNAQIAKGVNSNVAVACAFAYDSDHSLESYRGFDTAFSGGTSVSAVNVRDSYFWNNTKNLDADAWTSSRIEGNKFFDGLVRIDNSAGTKIRQNYFCAACEIDIAGGAGSEWSDNVVESGATITALDPNNFSIWKSAPYSKDGTTHTIRASAAIQSGTVTKQLIATLTAGTNRSAAVSWSLASRSATSGGAMYVSVGRAFIAWDNSGNPTVTLDANNFASGTQTTDFSIDISGTTVQLNFDYTAVNYNSLSEIEIKIVAAAVNVLPVNFLDTI